MPAPRLRVAALDAMTGLREVRAFGAEGRMLAAVQAREAGPARGAAPAVPTWAAAQAWRCSCRQSALLLVLVAGAAGPGRGCFRRFLLTLAAFEAVAVIAARRPAARGPCRRRGPPDRRRGGTRRLAVPEPRWPAPAPSGHALRFEDVGFRMSERPAVLED